MGQGQEKRADETIMRMSEVGGWVFLQNVHLMQTWLPTLDEKLETVSAFKYFALLSDGHFTKPSTPVEPAQKLPRVYLRRATTATLYEEHSRGPAAVVHLRSQ
jgi:hypothetical protein